MEDFAKRLKKDRSLDFKRDSIMKILDIHLVPIIGLGWFNNILEDKNGVWYMRTIIILFVKIQLYKKL